jgi:hypothetical protein
MSFFVEAQAQMDDTKYMDATTRDLAKQARLAARTAATLEERIALLDYAVALEMGRITITPQTNRRPK